MKNKKKKQVFEFYILLAAGLSICLVIAACIRQTPVSNKAVAEYAALSADYSKSEKQYLDLLNSHKAMAEAHGKIMAGGADSVHLAMERTHNDLLEAQHNLVTRHQLSMQLSSDLPSLKKDGHVDEAQVESDYSVLAKAHAEMKKDFDKIFAEMKTMSDDHRKMLSEHPAQ